ncbi:MAG: PAS domain-containing protein, partial [Caldisericia bacterium]|nr:PAS domain-containing protein [Caldisericia bacterium]
MKQTFDKKGSFFFSLLVVLASIGFWILYAIYDFLSLNQQISFLFFNEPLRFLDALFFNISYFSFLTRILVIAIFILAALTIRKTICSLREKNQELLEIQEKIQQNELLYRMLFDTNNDPIIMLKNWSIYKCNRKALSFFGYKSKEKLLSMLFLDLFPDTQEDGSSTKSIILDIQKRIVTQNFDISPLSLYCKTSDNKLKPVILTISPFVLNNEWFCQVLLRDISMQRIYENELISSRTMAKTANQGKNRFISIINHELHPPLREMEASFNTLREKLHDPSLIPYIEEIHKAQGSIQSLSRYMEIFSTLETSPISFRKEPVQFHDITEEIRKKYTPLFQKQDVHFSIDCNAKDFCLVLDRQKFYQIVDCMLLNTLRHTDAHGNVSVQLNM